MPFMCLDCIIARETFNFFPTLPLELAPTCSTTQCGTSFLKKGIPIVIESLGL
jgi:hypothetical protein